MFRVTIQELPRSFWDLFRPRVTVIQIVERVNVSKIMWAVNNPDSDVSSAGSVEMPTAMAQSPYPPSTH